MWSSLPQFSWQMITFMFFPFADHYLNTGPKTKAIVTVVKFVEWVSWVSNSMLVNLFWTVCMWVYNYYSLRSCPWGFTNNGTYFGGGTQGAVFSQSFTHFFRPTTTAFERFKFPLNAKDTILLLMFLLSLINTVHLAFTETVKLPWVATPKSAPETRDAVQKPAAGARDAAQQHHLQSEGKVDSAAEEPTDVTAVQAPNKPEGHPQPAAVTPVLPLSRPRG